MKYKFGLQQSAVAADLPDRAVRLPAPQDVEQIARKDDALGLPPRKPPLLPNSRCDVPLHYAPPHHSSRGLPKARTRAVGRARRPLPLRRQIPPMPQILDEVGRCRLSWRPLLFWSFKSQAPPAESRLIRPLCLCPRSMRRRMGDASRPRRWARAMNK
jgi:hypothetical protein